jgi:hypothetical protein
VCSARRQFYLPINQPCAGISLPIPQPCDIRDTLLGAKAERKYHGCENADDSQDGMSDIPYLESSETAVFVQ